MKTLAIAALLALAFDAGAVVLYKSIDATGRVTYSDQPPSANGARSVVPIDVDPYPPAAAPYKPPVALSRGEDLDQIIRRRPAAANDARVRAAQARLDAARAALEAAQASSTPEDWVYFGIRPGGPNRMPRPEYLARLESLDADVKAAEGQLADEERRLRLGF